jgi:hypothetical protein
MPITQASWQSREAEVSECLFDPVKPGGERALKLFGWPMLGRVERQLLRRVNQVKRTRRTKVVKRVGRGSCAPPRGGLAFACLLRPHKDMVSQERKITQDGHHSQ